MDHRKNASAAFNEYFSKTHRNPPELFYTKVGSGFICETVYEGTEYRGSIQTSKKGAKEDLCRLLLAALACHQENQENKPVSSQSKLAVPVQEKYVTMLTNLCVEMGFPSPSYSFTTVDAGYFCEGQLRGRVISNRQPRKSRAAAKEEVAILMYQQLWKKKKEQEGILDPDAQDVLIVEEAIMPSHETPEAETLFKQFLNFVDSSQRPSLQTFNSFIQEVVDQLETHLKRDFWFKPHHIDVVGSVGKKTFFPTACEVDLVAFFSDYQSQERTEFIQELATSLKSLAEVHQVKKCFDHVKLTVTDVHFNLYISKFMPGDGELENQNQLWKGSHFLPKFFKLFLNRLKGAEPMDPIVMEPWLPSLWNISSLQYLKRAEIYRDVVQVLKFWGGLLYFRHSFRAKSFLLELIATKVVETYERNPSEYQVKGVFTMFRTCLEWIRYPQQLNIVWNELYDLSYIPTKIRTQRPLVMDPCNPHNNVARNPDIPWIELANYAKEALEVIESCFSNIEGNLVVKMVSCNICKRFKLLSNGNTRCPPTNSSRYSNLALPKYTLFYPLNGIWLSAVSPKDMRNSFTSYQVLYETDMSRVVEEKRFLSFIGNSLLLGSFRHYLEKNKNGDCLLGSDINSILSSSLSTLRTTCFVESQKSSENADGLREPFQYKAAFPIVFQSTGDLSLVELSFTLKSILSS